MMSKQKNVTRAIFIGLGLLVAAFLTFKAIHNPSKVTEETLPTEISTEIQPQPETLPEDSVKEQEQPATE